MKIDQSFVIDLANNQEDAEIVPTIISMACSLHLEVVAEGVEANEALEFLRRLSCDVIQGYLFSRLQPAEEITKLLQSR